MSATSMRDRPTSPDSRPSQPVGNVKSPFPNAQLLLSPPATLRSLTGAGVYPPALSKEASPTIEKRYSRANLLLFRSASGEEKPLSPTDNSDAKSTKSDDSGGSAAEGMPTLEGKPRISSVTESTATNSPDQTHANLSLNVETPPTRTPLPDIDSIPKSPVDDDSASTYSHASAINLDDLDDDDLAGLRAHGLDDVDTGAPAVINRQVLEYRRQSFANSFAKARKAVDTRKAVVLARPELQPHNKSLTLIERCVNAFTEVLDLNLTYAKTTTDKFNSFSALYTRDERQVIGELLKEAAARLRNETPTPWRGPMHWNVKRPMIKSSPQQEHRLKPLENQSVNQQLSKVLRGPWGRRSAKQMSSDTLVRSVVFGGHVIPGVQSAESILMRMAGEYQRDEVNRKASRAERIDVPLSFAMTLTAAIATFARLDCSVSYRRYRSRSAANRRSNPQALLMLKTKYDGLKLSFGVTLHGEAPTTVLFRRPRTFSARKIDEYATVVTEAKEILAEFGREVVGSKD